MKKILSLIIAYFVFIGQAFAVTGVPDTQHWEYAGFGGGGAYPMIIHDHFTEDRVYGIGDVNSPFVTTNQGESWAFLSTLGVVNNGYTPTQTAAFVQSTNDANLMFALDSASGGLARSLDGGQSWTKVGSYANNKSQPAIALDKDDDNNVFVASYPTLYKSTDKGTTWISLGRPFDSIADAYATSSACTTAGATWSTSLGRCTIPIRFVYHDTVNEDLYLGSLKWGMIKYDLATDTTQLLSFTGTNALYNNNFDTYIDGSSVENFCVATGNRIACTSDFSEDLNTWTYTSVLTTSSSYYIDTFAIHRKSDTSINIAANRVLTSSTYTNSTHYSVNGGSTWSGAGRSNNTSMNPLGVFNAGNSITWIEDDPFNDGVFYLTTDMRLYRSDNSGQTFYEKDYGATMLVSHDIKISPNGRIFQVSMDTGVQYSDDFGATWTQGTPDVSKGQPFVTNSVNDYGGHYWQIELAGTKEEWDAGAGKVYIAATMYSTPVSLYYINFVLKSVDSGVTWTRSNSGLPTVRLFGDATWGLGYARALALSADESVLYVGMDGQGSGQTGGLFKSIDEGETFTRVWPTTPNRVFNALATDPTDPTGETLMFGTFRYNLYRITKITGETAELNGTGQTRTGSFNKPSQALNPVFTSSGGEIFSPVSVGSNTLVSNMGGSGTFDGYGGTYSLTFVSTPSTTTVTYQYRGYVGDTNGPGDYVVDVAYDSQGTPYAVSQVGGPRIYKSVTTAYGDGSGQWGTWQLMKNFGSSGLPDGLVIDPQNDNRIFVGVTEGSPSARRIYVTPNADKHNQSTWYDITGDFPVSGGCRALAINYFEGNQGYLYCASNGGGIWKLNLADSPASYDGRTCIGGCLDR